MSAEEGRAMSKERAEHARRRFLIDAGLATVGACASVLAAAKSVAAQESTPADDRCATFKAPLSEVEGKVAFITGGSSGVGLGIARAFAAAGMKIAVGYRTKKHLDEAMKYFVGAGQRVHAINIDVTDRSSMEQAAAETVKVFGKVHVLVNNAGIAGFASLKDTSYEDWSWMMDVNVNGVFNGVHSFLPRILSHGEGGHVIATSSMNGLIGVPGLACYTTSKFAVVGMMEALRAELDPRQIGVSAFCPSLVVSRFPSSSRNRPIGLPETSFNKGAEMLSAARAMADPKVAMDPLMAGQCVLRGMRNNDLYIFTHPGFEQILRRRSEALLASSPRARSAPSEIAYPPPLDESIYRTAMDWKQCAKI